MSYPFQAGPTPVGSSSASSAKTPSPTGPIDVRTLRPPNSIPSGSLFEAMWRSPDLHHQIGILDPRDASFRNIPVKNADEAIALARQHDNAGADVYFACAEYLTQDNRTAANAAGTWAFWIDIDCGPALKHDRASPVLAGPGRG